MLGQLVTGIGHGAYGLGQRQTWKNHICRSKARDKPPSFMRGFMTIAVTLGVLFASLSQYSMILRRSIRKTEIHS